MSRDDDDDDDDDDDADDAAADDDDGHESFPGFYHDCSRQTTSTNGWNNSASENSIAPHPINFKQHGCT